MVLHAKGGSFMKKNGMISQFYPDEWVDSTFEIDYEKLYKRGFRGILFDIDNTLVQHDAPADSRAGKLLQKLKRLGFKIARAISLFGRDTEPRKDSSRFMTIM